MHPPGSAHEQGSARPCVAKLVPENSAACPQHLATASCCETIVALVCTVGFVLHACQRYLSRATRSHRRRVLLSFIATSLTGTAWGRPCMEWQPMPGAACCTSPGFIAASNARTGAAQYKALHQAEQHTFVADMQHTAQHTCATQRSTHAADAPSQ